MESITRQRMDLVQETFSASDEPGPFYISSGVLAEATDGAIFEIIQEIKDYRERGITNDELQFMKNSIGNEKFWIMKHQDKNHLFKTNYSL